MQIMLLWSAAIRLGDGSTRRYWVKYGETRKVYVGKAQHPLCAALRSRPGRCLQWGKMRARGRGVRRLMAACCRDGSDHLLCVALVREGRNGTSIVVEPLTQARIWMFPRALAATVAHLLAQPLTSRRRAGPAPLLTGDAGGGGRLPALRIMRGWGLAPRKIP